MLVQSNMCSRIPSSLPCNRPCTSLTPPNLSLVTLFVLPAPRCLRPPRGLATFLLRLRPSSDPAGVCQLSTVVDLPLACAAAPASPSRLFLRERVTPDQRGSFVRVRDQLSSRIFSTSHVICAWPDFGAVGHCISGRRSLRFSLCALFIHCGFRSLLFPPLRPLGLCGLCTCPSTIRLLRSVMSSGQKVATIQRLLLQRKHDA